ncbi:MAG: hypothetical protein Q4A21_00870 [bacterium]|nr:hypothetical protein [bacterium]
MNTQELFEKFGRRFAIVEIGESGFFDFFEICAVKNEPPIIKNIKATITRNSALPIWGQDLEIEDFEVILENYAHFEVLNLAEDKPKNRVIGQICSACSKILHSEAGSDEFRNAENQAIQLFTRLLPRKRIKFFKK